MSRAGAHRRHGPAPFADAACGTCKWCGEPIVHGRVRQRSWHDGREDEPDCLLVYRIENDDLRAAWRVLILRDGLGCRGCGVPVVKRWGEHEPPVWAPIPRRPCPQVDHVVPVVDGGPRTVANLQLLCVPCHKAKTAREARARAGRAAEGQGALL